MTETPAAPEITLSAGANTPSGLMVVQDEPEQGPCGHDLLHQGAWLRHLVCTRGCPL